VRANRQINKPLKHQMFLLGTNMKQWPGTLAGNGRKWPEMAEHGRISRVAVTLHPKFPHDALL